MLKQAFDWCGQTISQRSCNLITAKGCAIGAPRILEFAQMLHTNDLIDQGPSPCTSTNIYFGTGMEWLEGCCERCVGGEVRQRLAVFRTCSQFWESSQFNSIFFLPCPSVGSLVGVPPTLCASVTVESTVAATVESLPRTNTENQNTWFCMNYVHLRSAVVYR